MSAGEHGSDEDRRLRPRFSTVVAAAVFVGALVLWIAGQAEEQSELPNLPNIVVTTTVVPTTTSTTTSTTG